MSNKFWLIQRGTFRDNLENAKGFLSGNSEALINPDYMGAAEFEWGAIPKAYRRILGQYDQYKLHVTDLVTAGGVPFCLYCREDRYEVILNAIKVYLKEHYRLKEWTNMHEHFETLPPDAYDWTKKDHKHALRTNFWWCIDVAGVEDKGPRGNDLNIVGDWIAFTGAVDRQKAFTRVLTEDHESFWMKMTDAERKEEFDKAFKRF